MHKSITPHLTAAALSLLLTAASVSVLAQQTAPAQEPAAGQAPAPQPTVNAPPTAPLKLQENAPDSYVVVKGDTLWGISGKFLKDAWRWPEIWKMNQEQIKNPHWIYPGDLIVLDMSGGDPRLRVVGRNGGDGTANGGSGRTTSGAAGSAAGGSGGTDVVKLSPRIRSEATSTDAIASIPASVIEPFLTQPLIIESNGLDKAPRVVATEESRVFLGAGNLAYVSGIGDNQDASWQFFRPGKPLVDPDTQKTLGYEALFLGTGRVEKSGDPATVREIGRAHV
jgi:nucleoid-associated protein YgaU